MDQMTEVPAWLTGAKSLADVTRLAHDSQKDTVPLLLWMRCALAGRWNEALYSALVQDLPSPDLPFDEFRNLAGVSCSDSICSLAEQVRTGYLKQWKREDPELARTSALLEEYYLKAGDFDRQLEFLLLARPDEGIPLFLERYTAADRGFDLGRCEALLRILRGQYLLHCDAARNVLNEREQYLQSREIFAPDYYRSLVYLSRDNLEKDCDVILADSGPWILNLYGQGGLGKTMFVRRLIAHRCIPEFNSERTPVARVDLDFLDLALLADHPALLFLEAARQLRPQLVGSPFLTLLGPEHLALARLLRSKATAPRPEDRKWMEISSLRRRGEIESVFVQGLGDKRAVLIVDTLEEILLHRPQALIELLGMFFAVRDRCKGFRLLLSGRYALLDANRKPLPLSEGLRQRLTTEMAAVQIQPFSDDSSGDYLRNLRHLEDGGVVKAIVKRSGGNPFELSLFAELARTRPLLTVDAVEKCPDVKLAYLVERVIDRMPDEPVTRGDTPAVVRQKLAQFGARWLVRYAVIPRVLTLSFIANVLRRFLEDEMSGITRKDDTVVTGYEAERWRREPVVLDDEALEDLWNELQKYASEYNWVEGDEQKLQLHAEVVVPMRELLRQKPNQYPIYNELHLAGAEYFERLAGPRGGPPSPKAGQYLADALYHRFQMEGQAARPYWKDYLLICRAVSARAVTDLTISILNTKDYLDDDGQPLAHFRAGLLIDRETLAEISLEHAHACLLAWLRSLQPSFTDVAIALQKGLEDWEHFGGTAQRAPRGWLCLLEAAQAFFANRKSRVQELLEENWIVTSLDPEDKIAARLLLMRIWPRGTVESDWQYMNALEAGNDSATAAFPAYYLRAINGQNQARGNTLIALQQLDQACEEAFRDGADPAEAGMILQWFGDLSYSHGQRYRLEQICRKFTSDAARFPFPVREQASDWLVRCLVDRCLYREAAEVTRAVSLDPVKVGLEAQIAAAEFRFDDARKLYDQAEKLYKKHSLESGSIGLRLELANLYLEKMGNAIVAQSYLNSVKEPLEMLDRVTLLQLGIRVSAARATPEETRHSYRESLERLSKWGMPDLAHATTRATFLSTGLGNADDRRDFAEQLQKLPLSSSRYAALEPFITADLWRPVPHSEEMRSMLIEPVDSPDWFQHNLAFAAACRFFSAHEKLARALRRGMEHAADRYQLFAVRRLIPKRLAKELLAPAGYLQQWQTGAKEESAFAAVAFLVEAEQAFHRQDFEIAGELVERYFALASHSLPKHQQWSMRALFLRAEIAGVEGQRGDADRTLEEGAGLASEMGDQAALEFFRETKERKSFSFTPLAPQSELNHDECRIDLDPGGLRVSFRSGAGYETFAVKDTPAAHMIANDFSDLYPQELIEPLRHPNHGMAAELAGILRMAPLNPAEPLRLKIPLSAASAVPWEMALPILGATGMYRSTNFPIAQAPKFPDLAPGVLIIHPEAEAERSLKRGYGLTGLSIAESYQSAGIRIVGTISPEWNAIQDALQNLAPSFIHISCAMRDSTTPREALLESRFRFADSPNEQWLAPSPLATLLQPLPSPLIILDTNWDPDDDCRQVLLRNYFAASLFESSTLRGILATGGYPPDRMAQFLEVLTSELSQRSQLIDLHAALLRHTKPDFPPALFTNKPDARVF